MPFSWSDGRAADRYGKLAVERPSPTPARQCSRLCTPQSKEIARTHPNAGDIQSGQREKSSAKPATKKACPGYELPPISWTRKVKPEEWEAVQNGRQFIKISRLRPEPLESPSLNMCSRARPSTTATWSAIRASGGQLGHEQGSRPVQARPPREAPRDGGRLRHRHRIGPRHGHRDVPLHGRRRPSQPDGDGLHVIELYFEERVGSGGSFYTNGPRRFMSLCGCFSNYQLRHAFTKQAVPASPAQTPPSPRPA